MKVKMENANSQKDSRTTCHQTLLVDNVIITWSLHVIFWARYNLYNIN